MFITRELKIIQFFVYINSTTFVNCFLQIVVVVREPKDTAVSFYHHHCVFNGYCGTVDKFLEAFMEGCGKL